ncbi:MAG: putative signal transducing protein [Solirubrobacterales bacterium]
MQISADNTCPFCGVEFEYGASACPSCDLPLLSADDIASANLSAEKFERSVGVGMLAVADRRPRPEYAIGNLRRVVVAMNLAEADMLEHMLRSEGIPCVVRRASRADLPDFGASGQREILVPEGGLAAARALLRIEPSRPVERAPSALTFAALAVISCALAVIAAIVFLAFA